MSRAGASYKPRRAKNVCVCVVCKRSFQSTRYDAKTCSPRCRKALSRGTSVSVRNGNDTGRTVTINHRGESQKMLFDPRQDDTRWIDGSDWDLRERAKSTTGENLAREFDEVKWS